MKQFAGIVVRFLLRLWFRIEVHGAEHVRQNRPSKLLIVSNHVSFIDGILLGAFLPFEPTYLIHTAFVDRWYLRPWLKLIRYLALEKALGLRPDYAPLGKLVRQKLRELGTPPLVEEPTAAPIVTTFVPPRPSFVQECRELGYSIGGESGYLAKRGLVQIANMGAVRAEQIEQLFDQLA